MSVNFRTIILHSLRTRSLPLSVPPDMMNCSILIIRSSREYIPRESEGTTVLAQLVRLTALGFFANLFQAFLPVEFTLSFILSLLYKRVWMLCLLHSMSCIDLQRNSGSLLGLCHQKAILTHLVIDDSQTHPLHKSRTPSFGQKCRRCQARPAIQRLSTVRLF